MLQKEIAGKVLNTKCIHFGILTLPGTADKFQEITDVHQGIGILFSEALVKIEALPEWENIKNRGWCYQDTTLKR